MIKPIILMLAQDVRKTILHGALWTVASCSAIRTMYNESSAVGCYFAEIN